MAQPSWSTLETDPAQFAPQVAYSTEKQIPYDTSGLEFHDESPIQPQTKRICGLRKTTLGIIVGLTLIIVIALGIGIGLRERKLHSQSHPPTSSPTSTSNPSLPTGTSGAPILPTGTFNFPVLIATNISGSCVTASEAWACSIAPVSANQISVTANGNNTYQLSLIQDTSNQTGYIYGVQYPGYNGSAFGPPNLITDVSGTGLLGPVYSFLENITKLVVVQESDITVQKRQTKQVVVGDRPWFCYWNQTQLQVLISTSVDKPAVNATEWPTTIKFEELSGNSDNIPEFCEQMIISDDGSATAFAGTNKVSVGGAVGCGCQWLVD